LRNVIYKNSRDFLPGVRKAILKNILVISGKGFVKEFRNSLNSRPPLTQSKNHEDENKGKKQTNQSSST
jgi:hypothetical protein